MSERETLEVELSDLRATNANATSWGAAVGARSERIKEIERELRRMDSSAGAPSLNTSLCQCENPAIECGATGCRCRLCGEPARMVGMDWKLSDDAKARIAEIEACMVKLGDPRMDQIVGGPQPSRSAAIAAEPVADSYLAERKKAVYQKLAEEGGGTWATYMMMDIEEAFAAPTTSPHPVVAKNATTETTEPDAVRALRAIKELIDICVQQESIDLQDAKAIQTEIDETLARNDRVTSQPDTGAKP